MACTAIEGGQLRMRRGRPRWEPTCEIREWIKDLASRGVPQIEIAKVVGTSEATLQRRCRHELKTGKLIANARIAMTAFEMAVSGKHPQMTRFWLRCNAGWSEKRGVSPPVLDVLQYIPGDEGL